MFTCLRERQNVYTDRRVNAIKISVEKNLRGGAEKDGAIYRRRRSPTRTGATAVRIVNLSRFGVKPVVNVIHSLHVDEVGVEVQARGG